MDSRIEQLAALFRQRERIDLRLSEILAGGGDGIEDQEAAEKVVKVAKKAFTETFKKPAGTGQRVPRPRLSPEQKEAIADDLRAGKKIKQICQDRGVSSNTVWKISKNLPALVEADKPAKTAKKEEAQTDFQRNYGKGPVQYTCQNKHTFLSTEPLDRIFCPICRSQDVEAGGTKPEPQGEEDDRFEE